MINQLFATHILDILVVSTVIQKKTGIWDWILPPGARNSETAAAAAIWNKLLHRMATKKERSNIQETWQAR
ncbi:hypothetical protein MKX01_025268 [Papaver californicum]|nr:hypothetical protein MKX01_025268 [Papaver californicum]